jgi:ubiquinol oxidase
MLHLYESLGWFKAPELRKIHAAEDWNELHHLLIMETLGGNRSWSDRFLGNHVALIYYWLLVLVYLFSPSVAYQFMELLEAHAVDTYSTFVAENRSLLMQLPAPQVAKSYYTSGDLYLCTSFLLTPCL